MSVACNCAVPASDAGIRIRGRVVINNGCRIRNQIEVQGQIFLVTTIAPRQRGIIRSQNQGYLAGIERTKEVGILTVTGLRQAYGL